jgi:hypothetical protein
MRLRKQRDNPQYPSGDSPNFSLIFFAGRSVSVETAERPERGVHFRIPIQRAPPIFCFDCYGA